MNIDQIETLLRPTLSLAQSGDNAVRKANEDKLREIREAGPVSDFKFTLLI